MSSVDIGIYYHIPFCRNKCPYCSFNSIETESIPERRYVEALLAELETIAKNEFPKRRPRLDSIYFGGGTPTLLSAASIVRLVKGANALFGRRRPGGVEITLEANPESVNRERLENFYMAGVNRLSLGVQSFNDAHLAALGRTHNALEALTAINDARAAGFRNISIDLIYAVPDQTPEQWKRVLYEALLKEPEHISVYGLTIEKGVPFNETLLKGRSPLPDEESEIEMYRDAVSLFTDAGYVHYEISNFARPGKESRHNSRYWLGGDYLGIGAGAHSYLNGSKWGRRWWNEPDPYQYMKNVTERGAATTGSEELGIEEAKTEAVMLGLRLIRGIDLREYEKRFGMALDKMLDIDGLEQKGLIRTDGAMITLSQKGLLLTNEVIRNGLL